MYSFRSENTKPLKPGVYVWNVFRWLVQAVPPLRASELGNTLALLCRPRKHKDLELAFNISRSVQRLCGPFVRIESSQGTVNLVHQSAKAFFLKSYSLIMLPGHEMIMNSCLTYICFPDILYGPVSFLLARNPQHSTSIQEFERYKFLRYATTFRYSHYESHQTRTQPPRVPLQQVDQGGDGYEAERCLAFASMAEFDHNTRDVGGRTALHLAVFWGWHRATDALLGIPGIDDCCIDDFKYSRLHLAYYWSLSATTEKLIAHGGWKSAFDVNSRDGTRCTF